MDEATSSLTMLTVVIEALSRHIDAALFRSVVYVDPRCDRTRALVWAKELVREGVEQGVLAGGDGVSEDKHLKEGQA